MTRVYREKSGSEFLRLATLGILFAATISSHDGSADRPMARPGPRAATPVRVGRSTVMWCRDRLHAGARFHEIGDGRLSDGR